MLSPESNAFINKFLVRLLNGTFSRDEDKALLAKARSWLISNLQSSLEAIYNTIFSCREGQTPQERQREFADHLLAQATKILPQAHNQIIAISKMSDEELTLLANEWKADESKKAHHTALNESKELKPLLKSIVASLALEAILQRDLNKEILQPFLPPFLQAETICNLIYTFLAPYVVEITEQLEEIELHGQLQDEQLTGWMQKGLSYARAILERKAASGSLQVTKYSFINELLANALKPTTGELKGLIDKKIIQLITVIIKAAIGQDPSEEALSEVVNKLLTECQKKADELIQAEDDHVVEASKAILEQIFSKALAESLLPPFLRTSGLWEAASELVAGYMKGLIQQAKLIKNSNAPQELTLKVPALKNLIKTLHTKIVSHITTNGTAANLLKAKPLQDLVEKVLPTILEGLVAYHVNPKDGLTSEKRTAQLAFTFIAIAQKGFERVSSYEAAENKADWLEEHGFSRDAVDVEALLLQETTRQLIDTLLPNGLITMFVPKEFGSFVIDNILTDLIYTFVKDAYAYSHTMGSLATGATKAHDEQLKELHKYLEAEIQGYFTSNASKEKSWVEEVARQIFTEESSEQKKLLVQFTSNIYYGAIGFIFKTTDGSKDHLKLFEPIAASAQKAFGILNNEPSLEKLGLSQLDVEQYQQATQKPVELKQLTYWHLARRALDVLFSDASWNERIPEFLRTVLTKDTAANFAMTAYETVHSVTSAFEKMEQVGRKEVAKHAGLDAFIKLNLLQPLKLILQGIEGEPLELPAILSALVKECLKDTSTKIGEIRDNAIERALYSIAGKLLADKTPILQHAHKVIESYNKGNLQDTSAKLLEIALPLEVLDTPGMKLFTSNIAQKQLADWLGQIKTSQELFVRQGQEAKAYLESLPGMKPLLDDIMQNADNALENMTTVSSVAYIDALVKAAVKDKVVGPIIKKTIHNALWCILEEALTPKLGQTVQERAVEVAAKIAGGDDWLKTLIPESRLKTLVPELLQKTITHETLMRWFFAPYVAQVASLKKQIDQENAQPNNVHRERANQFVTKILLNHTKPTATTHGLLGFSGTPRELERALLSTLKTDANDLLTPLMQSYLHATCSQIVSRLEAKGMLTKTFIPDALIHSLPALENKEMLVPNDKEFASSSCHKLLSLVFPHGKSDLLVPDVAKDFIWEKANKAITYFFDELTNPDRRILWLLDRLAPFTTDDEKVIGKKLQATENMRHNLDSGLKPNAKVLEATFKRYAQEAIVHQAMRKVEESSLWGPFKWLAKQVVRAVTYVAARFSLVPRMYSFIQDPATDTKLRRAIWAFLHYDPTQAVSDELRKKELEKIFKKTINSQSLAPNLLQDLLAKETANWFMHKDALDILL